MCSWARAVPVRSYRCALRSTQSILIDIVVLIVDNIFATHAFVFRAESMFRYLT